MLLSTRLRSTFIFPFCLFFILFSTRSCFPLGFLSTFNTVLLSPWFSEHIQHGLEYSKGIGKLCFSQHGLEAHSSFFLFVFYFVLNTVKVNLESIGKLCFSQHGLEAHSSFFLFVFYFVLNTVLLSPWFSEHIQHGLEYSKGIGKLCFSQHGLEAHSSFFLFVFYIVLNTVKVNLESIGKLCFSQHGLEAHSSFFSVCFLFCSQHGLAFPLGFLSTFNTVLLFPLVF